MSDQVTLEIDGHAVTVPKGTNVLEAAKLVGIDITYFCYHPGLSSPAVCRQCLVEVSGNPKLVPSCYTTVAEGMKVAVASEKATTARRQMLEFTLVNHPIDCPICDKAGECTLQKHYHEANTLPSRVDENKVHKGKRIDLGPTIVLDQERCILCTRCIRVCDEVAGVHQLEMAHRGDREVLTTAPGHLLDNPYSLNTVDVCPVGALTAKDFRFAMRAWELFSTPTICNGCATGCNIELQHQESRAYRIVPRHHAEVNRYWMCDEGRMTYKALHQGRAATPVVDGMPASWEKALATAAEQLEAARDRGPDGVGVVFSATHSNEDNWALARLARDHLRVGRVYVAGRAAAPERADKILRDADVNANSVGARAIAGAGGAVGGLAELEDDLASGKLRALLVLGADVPLSPAALERAHSLEALVVIATREQDLATVAKVVLPAADWAEVHGTITNRQGRTQRLRAAFPPVGQALPAWEIVIKLGRKLGAMLDYPYPRALFLELTEKVPSLATGEWGKESPLVQLRFAGSRG